MRPVDATLLERAGGRQVVVLPTAAAPDGQGVPERWAEMGVRHFEGLGARVEPVMALDHASCYEPRHAAAVRRANLVYLSGGKPGYLLNTLRSTLVWQAILAVLAGGGVLAGCSAGAMILGGWIPGRPGGRLSLWQSAFGLLPSTVILPHFDEMPGWITGSVRWLRPRPSTLVGIDAGTVLLAAAGERAWQVLGSGRVVVQEAGRRAVYRQGSAVDRRAAG